MEDRTIREPKLPASPKSNAAGHYGAEWASGGEWESFLQRRPLVLDRARTAAALQGKRILITGAGGWIGSALTRAIAAFAPARLILLEAAERSLYGMVTALEQLPNPNPFNPILGSVTDRVLVEETFRRYRPQIVYHAAAFKHVPLMEQNPFAAIQNNALGSNLLFQAAEKHGVEQFLLLSTDKAVDPVNIMGASKRIAELILLTRRTTATRAKAVRLGNVLGSDGSVVPVFRRQILAGGPVTITHPEARRYFLTTTDAVTLLLHASWVPTEGTILVPELGEPFLLQSLVRYLLAHGAAAGRDVPIVFTRLRPGDKLCEALLSSREAYVASAAETQLRVVDSPGLASPVLDEILQQLQQACLERSLERLLATVLRGVPEYRPSALLLAAVNTPAAEEPA